MTHILHPNIRASIFFIQDNNIEGLKSSLHAIAQSGFKFGQGVQDVALITRLETLLRHALRYCSGADVEYLLACIFELNFPRLAFDENTNARILNAVFTFPAITDDVMLQKMKVLWYMGNSINVAEVIARAATAMRIFHNYSSLLSFLVYARMHKINSSHPISTIFVQLFQEALQYPLPAADFTDILVNLARLGVRLTPASYPHLAQYIIMHPEISPEELSDILLSLSMLGYRAPNHTNSSLYDPVLLDTQQKFFCIIANMQIEACAPKELTKFLGALSYMHQDLTLYPAPFRARIVHAIRSALPDLPQFEFARILKCAAELGITAAELGSHANTQIFYKITTHATDNQASFTLYEFKCVLHACSILYPHFSVIAYLRPFFDLTVARQLTGANNIRPEVLADFLTACIMQGANRLDLTNSSVLMSIMIIRMLSPARNREHDETLAQIIFSMHRLDILSYDLLALSIHEQIFATQLQLLEAIISGMHPITAAYVAPAPQTAAAPFVPQYLQQQATTSLFADIAPTAQAPQAPHNNSVRNQFS